MNSTTIKAISTNKLLKNVDLETIDHSSIEGNLKIVREGKIIYRLGEKAEEMFLIVKGEVKFLDRDSDKNDLKLTQNDFFGHDDLFGYEVRQNTAVAATDVYLILFSKDDFSTLLNYSAELRLNAGIETDDQNFRQEESSSSEDNSDIYNSYVDDDEFERLENKMDEKPEEDLLTEDEDEYWQHYTDSEDEQRSETVINSEVEFNTEKGDEDFQPLDSNIKSDEDFHKEENVSHSNIGTEENSEGIRKEIFDEPDDDWSKYQEYQDSATEENNLDMHELSSGESLESFENEAESLSSESPVYKDPISAQVIKESEETGNSSEEDENDTAPFEKRELITKGDYIESEGYGKISQIDHDLLLKKLPYLYAKTELHEVLIQIVDFFNELFQPDQLGFAYADDFGKKLKFVIYENHSNEQLAEGDATVNIPDFLDSENPIALKSHEFNKDLVPEKIKDSVNDIAGILFVPVKSKNKRFNGIVILVNETEEFDEQIIPDAEIAAKFCSAAIDNSIKLEALESSIRNSAFESFKKKTEKDIKQPLLLAERFAEYLNKQETGEELKSAIETLLDSIKSASHGLLFFEELDSSNEVKHSVKLDLSYLIENTIADFTDRYDNANIKFETDLQKNIIVTLFPEDLKLCISEILKNSFESMNEGEIEISSIFDEQNAVIKIKDNGCGIPIKERDKVFEPFYSYNKIDRPGLGLTAARAILNKYKGTISIESKVDQGTTVTFTLPASLE